MGWHATASYCRLMFETELWCRQMALGDKCIVVQINFCSRRWHVRKLRSKMASLAQHVLRNRRAPRVLLLTCGRALTTSTNDRQWPVGSQVLFGPC